MTGLPVSRVRLECDEDDVMKWFLYCTETERGVYFGRVRAKDEEQAHRLIKQWLLNLGHCKVAQVVTHEMRHGEKDEFLIQTFDQFLLVD